MIVEVNHSWLRFAESRLWAVWQAKDGKTFVRKNRKEESSITYKSRELFYDGDGTKPLSSQEPWSIWASNSYCACLSRLSLCRLLFFFVLLSFFLSFFFWTSSRITIEATHAYRVT